MKIVKRVDEAINPLTIPPGTIVYTGGNAATPQVLLRELINNEQIRDIELLSILLLGDV